jgi:hypothetical protein
MSTPSDLPPPMNHVFVDFENVHEVDASLIGTKAVSFTLLVGPKQTKLDTDLVEKMLAHAASVELIRLTAIGKNAVDFALAYYMGRKAVADPMAFFHIISKDQGYDPLIAHLRSRHIRAHRHDSFATLTFTRTTKAAVVAPKSELPGPEDLMDRLLAHLRKNVSHRPKKKQALLNHLKSQMGKDATDAAAAAMLKNLAAKHLTVGDKDAVTYHL